MAAIIQVTHLLSTNTPAECSSKLTKIHFRLGMWWSMESCLSICAAAGECLCIGSHRHYRIFRRHCEGEEAKCTRSQWNATEGSVCVETYSNDWHTAAENLVVTAIRFADMFAECIAQFERCCGKWTISYHFFIQCTSRFDFVFSFFYLQILFVFVAAVRPSGWILDSNCVRSYDGNHRIFQWE